MKGFVCLLEFKKIDTKCKLHGLWVTLMVSAELAVATIQHGGDNAEYVSTMGSLIQECLSTEHDLVKSIVL